MIWLGLSKYMKKCLVMALILSWSTSVWSADPFVVQDIRVDGLQRIDEGTVYNEIPVTVGQTFSTDNSETLIRALFKTGFFSDVHIARRGNTLIIQVVERPSIAKINVTGNEDIKTADLTTALQNVGIAEGRTFEESTLSKVEQELEQQYFSRGKYSAVIKSTVTNVDRNRVEIDINISEGVAAKIRQIHIVGNQAYSEETLIEQFASTTPGWFTWLSDSDQYSKERLKGDLENIRSYYLDRGYLNFDIDSTQVSITPDKKDIYITVNVTEGDKYTISDIKLSGDLIVPEAELMKLVRIKSGALFSRRLVTDTVTVLSNRLGNEGYAFAKVNSIPTINEEDKTVSINFFVDPGRRYYVRKINFHGNHTTTDEVLRREMRQMESAWVSNDKIERSRTNLLLLGFFSDVTMDTKPVPDSNDEVDVDVQVKEQPSGNITGGLGYSQVDGLLLNAGVRQNNFLGSGDMADISFSHSASYTAYRVGYNDPYYTVNGVSRGFDAYYVKTDAGEENISNYTRDSLGGSVRYGIPLTEHDRFNFAINPEQTRLTLSSDLTTVSGQVLDFVEEHGSDFNLLKLKGNWTHNELDRAVFPVSGWIESLSAVVAVPGSDLNFYTINSTSWWYIPLYENKYILAFNADLGYGNGYGKDDALPFFENFYGGGIGSVRGYRGNTLGPRDSLGDPMGGNVLIAGTTELIFPTPFIEMPSIRTSWFVDGGNVYDTQSGDSYGAGGLRFSSGLMVQWISPMGPFVFSIARALNVEEGDEEEAFQFTIGTMF